MSAEPGSVRLLERLRRGEDAAYRELLGDHGPTVLRVARAVTGDGAAAEDVAQETFLRLVRALDRIEHDAMLRPWLRRVATNLALNEVRARGRARRHALAAAQAGAAAADGGGGSGGGSGGNGASPGRQGSDDPVRAAEQRETAALVRAALDGLAPDRRAALYLRHMEEMSYEEIARVLGCPIGTVMSRLHRARADLKRELSAVLGSDGLARDFAEAAAVARGEERGA